MSALIPMYILIIFKFNIVLNGSAAVMSGIVYSSDWEPFPLGIARPIVDDETSEGNYKKLFKL